MSQTARQKDQDLQTPYCQEYWQMVSDQDLERAAALEDALAEFSSAAEYHAFYVPPPNDEVPEQIPLDEFEDIFRSSPYVY